MKKKHSKNKIKKTIFFSSKIIRFIECEYKKKRIITIIVIIKNIFSYLYLIKNIICYFFNMIELNYS
jgi:hypothetical protein